ncbi:MAG: histidine phosphotransferase family protein [Hyphomicrobiales bacterium]
MADTSKELEASDLGALLCSKVCHDIISPVGAITNGLELMEEDIDGSMRDMAMDLIKRSATQASAKLKFARIAYGAAGSAGAEIDTGDAEEVAQGYMVAEKADLEWKIERQYLPKNQVKLVLNLLLLALNCVPQGGEITISMEKEDGNPSFKLLCSGLKARIAESVAAMVKSLPEEELVDAHTVQPYYCGLLARLSGLNITMLMEGEDAVITASA